jgi:hypothetical protein
MYVLMHFLGYRRPWIIMCGPDQANTGKEKDGSQQSIHNQAFDLFCARGLHKNDSEVNEACNAQKGEYNAKCPFNVHVADLFRQKDANKLPV